MKKIVYTAIIGDYDTLKEPLVITPGWEYLCFTDQPLKSRAWQIIKVETEADKIRQARKIKIIPPFEYDECLWMDASFLIKGDMNEFTKYFQSDLVLPRHPHRSNIKDEAQKIIDLGKDDCETVNDQLRNYFTSTTFRNSKYILPATGIIYRTKSKRNQWLSEFWFNEIMKYSHRDQLSFNFSSLITGSDPLFIPDNIYDKNHPLFFLEKHK